MKEEEEEEVLNLMKLVGFSTDYSRLLVMVFGIISAILD